MVCYAKDLEKHALLRLRIVGEDVVTYDNVEFFAFLSVVVASATSLLCSGSLLPG